MDISASPAEEGIRRVYRAQKTTLEMLTDRGYHIPKACLSESFRRSVL